MNDEVFNIMKKSVEAKDAEEAYNAIKKSVEAINTRPYATLAEYEKVECIKILLTSYEKQQKEIERLKEEAIGDTKFDKLLFSIRMLHFHNYVNDKQFAEMIKKLSNENKGE